MAVNEAAWWDSYSVEYPLISRLYPFWRSLGDVIASAAIENNSRVLDLGCGTGFLQRALREHGLRPALVEVDFSSAMLAQAMLEPYDGPVEFHEADLNQPRQTWGLNGTFSQIIINNTLNVLDDPTSVLKALSSLARRNAVIVVSTPRANPSMDAILEEHLRLVAQRGGDPETERRELLSQAARLIAFNQQLVSTGVTKEQLFAWFAGSGWEADTLINTYSGQNWLLRAKVLRKR